ncbi:PepSY domain-containing protein [Bacillus tianshenii]|uniref:PepSY domain-containing protein n=1 Tax=Sutcliffiella tianshenii TaxID=1463404 RepID=UPI001CD2632B|nr:PepSY domain-containing protein [Bacillus tianshenii]MCA1321759.1 PepSY domain-containing protein [Bacillus tianshenii]
MKIFTAVMAGAVLIGGVSVGAEVLKKDNQEQNLQQVENAETNQKGITLDEASEIALAKVKNGVISEAEKDRENGRYVYEIEVEDDRFEYDFKISQENGEILKEKKENRDDDSNRQKDASTENKDVTLITLEKAEEVALQEVKGTVESVELDRENGSHVYEVEVDTGKKNGDDDEDVTVYVDAVTGKMLYVDWDD